MQRQRAATGAPAGGAPLRGAKWCAAQSRADRRSGNALHRVRGHHAPRSRSVPARHGLSV